MNNREEVVTAVNALYAARNSGDVAATLNCIHADCAFRIMGTEELSPFTAPVNGLEEMGVAAEILIANWDLNGLETVGMTIDGDTACVHRSGTVRFLPDNTTIETQVMDKISFRDGKAVEYFQFADTYLLAKTAGAPDNQETLRKFYDARNRADLNELLGYLHPRCVFRIVGHPGLGSFTEVSDTPERMRAAVAALFEAWDLRGLNTVEMHRSGDTVFVHRKGNVRFIPANISFETELMDKFTFKDGLIIELLQFVDTDIVTLVLAKAGVATR